MLTGNDDIHKSLDEFEIRPDEIRPDEIRPDPTTELAALKRLKN